MRKCRNSACVQAQLIIWYRYNNLSKHQMPLEYFSVLWYWTDRRRTIVPLMPLKSSKYSQYVYHNKYLLFANTILHQGNVMHYFIDYLFEKYANERH